MKFYDMVSKLDFTTNYSDIKMQRYIIDSLLKNWKTKENIDIHIRNINIKNKH